MKGGVAVQLALAASLFDGGAEPAKDVTFVFYDHEEVEAVKSGLGRLVRNHGGLLDGDFAILLEPTDGTVEGGCNGTMRLRSHHGRGGRPLRTGLDGQQRHPRRRARSWNGSRRTSPQTINVDGLDYRESLNAVKIHGGTAGNVIPDRCVVEINYRFAPDKTPDQAEAHVRELLEGFDVVRTDSAAGARPGLTPPRRRVLRGSSGSRAETQIRLDRRRAIQRARHPGSELRARRCAAGAQGQRARGGRC